MLSILGLTLTSWNGSERTLTMGLVHLAEQFVLFAALGAAIAGRYAASDAARHSPRRILLMTVLVVWLFVAAGELAQDYVHGHGTKFVDWMIGMIGVIVGIFTGSMLLRIFLKTNHGDS